jgi:hypothetical protein
MISSGSNQNELTLASCYRLGGRCDRCDAEGSVNQKELKNGSKWGLDKGAAASRFKRYTSRRVLAPLPAAPVPRGFMRIRNFGFLAN